MHTLIKRVMVVRILTLLLIIGVLITPLVPVFAQEADLNAAPAEVSNPEPEPILESPEETSTPLTETEEEIQPEAGPEPKPGEDEKSESLEDPESSQSLMSEEEESVAAPKTTTQTKLPKTDEVSGALVYDYPIVVPPGRNEMQPDLRLIYNSQNAHENGAIFGSGWDISIPYIERINKKGTDKLYTENYFNSSLSGELVQISGGTYGPKVERGDFLKYDLTSNVWTVTDKNGTVFKFGIAASSRQDNPSDSSKIYKWMLEEVRDRNDNFVSYEYYKDNGQIYPSKIFYTGSGSTDGIFEVELIRSSRTDIITKTFVGFSITTNYKITEIHSKISGSWIRKLILAHSVGDNTVKSILDTITESGIESGNIVALPAINFDYQIATTAGGGWSSNTSLSSPVDFTRGTIIADVNGDSLPDILQSYKNNSGQTVQSAYVNNGNSGWSQDTNFTPPVIFWDEASSPKDRGVRAGDLNGDLKIDLLQRVHYGGGVEDIKAFLNTGSGWSDVSSTWQPAITFADYTDTDLGGRFIDVNGDGLTDLVNNNEVRLNNGNGWTLDSGWTVPVDLIGGVILNDFNGDGLLDILKSYNNGGTVTSQAYIHNGNKGWSAYNALNPPIIFGSGLGLPDEGIRDVDINGDGLIDLLRGNGCGGGVQDHYINKGTGWTHGTKWASPVFINCNGTDAGVRAMDLNGDGMSDMVTSIGSPVSSGVFYNDEKKGDLLTKINYSSAGYTDVVYKATPLYKNGSTLLNPNFYVAVDTVYQITNNDGLGTSSLVTYTYEGGLYYFNNAFDRRFAGFSKITKTNDAGHKTVTYYHQGNSTNSSQGENSDHGSKIGRVYRAENTDSSANIYSKTIYKWENYDLGNGRNFVKLTQSLEQTYDGDSDHKDKASSFAYSNTNGNLTQRVDYGEVTGSDNGAFTDTRTDKFTTDYMYASNTTYNILGLPSQETVIDQSSNKVKESKYYYDAQSQGSVNKGNLTKEENWKSGSTYIDVEKTYNSYGLIATEKDPRDKTTTYTYDTHNLYPVAVTNALSQETDYLYDYSVGKPKQLTDVNNFVYQTVYDGLDRVVEEKQPDLTTPSTLVTKTAYQYTNLTVGLKVKKTDHLDASTSVDTYSYSDGLGRLIQTRTEAEDANTFAVSDVVYNNIEQVHKESLPYFSTGSDKTSATSTTALYTTYAYDPMMRPTSVVNAVGTTANTYDDWKTSVTDPRSNSKHLYKDAYGNLVKVEEVNGANTYTTLYEYNGLNNLIKITDALSNIRNFTYDGLGRRLTAQDLHASTDSSFGTWTYAYDDSGNMTSSVDPKSQTINYTYDDLNRQLTENFTGQTGTEVTYVYDSCTNGVGLLCTVTNAGANEAKEYNSLGLIKKDTKTIASTNYITEYTYNRQGLQVTLKNPDNSEVKNIYNSAGLLEQVQRKESTDGSFINVVTDFDYGPHGKVSYEAYQNGTQTTNTYDATKLYRLSEKFTTNSSSTRLQDLEYTYDANGNITKIIDDSQTNSKKTVDYVYDPFNRLTSATTTGAVNGQNYTQTYAYDAVGNILNKSDQGNYSYEGNQGSNYANPHAVTKIVGSGSAAISHDSTSVTGEQNNVSSATLSHTTGSLTNGLIVVGLQIRNGANGVYTGASSCTYNGNSLTLAKAQNGVSANNRYLRSELWYGLSPASGAHNVVCNFSASVSMAIMGASTFSGVVQTSPLDATAGINNSSSATASVSVTTVTDKALVVDSTYHTCDDPLTIGSNQTQLWQATPNSGGDHTAASYKGPITPAGSAAMSLTCPYADEWVAVGAAFKPAASSGTTTNHVVYEDSGLSSGWADWSWSTTLSDNSSVVYDGTTSLQAVYGGDWTGASFHHDGVSTSSSTHLQFAVRSPVANPSILIEAYDASSTWLGNVSLSNYVAGGNIAANTWYLVNIPLEDLNADATTISRVSFVKSASGTMYYDKIAFVGPTGGTTINYTYDNNGNLTGEGTWTHTWDYDNRIIQSQKSGVTVTYTYDHAGQRVKLANGTTTTIYPSKFYNIEGSNRVKHIYAGDQLVATVTGTGASASIKTIHTDHLTGSNVVTNSSGALEELMDYYPYGGIRLNEKSGSFSEQRKFTGQEYDVDTQLSYMLARYYSGNTGKFISQDPAFWDFSRLGVQLADPQSWNSYAYARNNPLKYNDPDGQFWDTVVDVGFTAWDGSRFLQHGGTWLGDQVSIGLGKLTGSERLENNGRRGAVESGAALKSASVDLSIDIAATAVPGVPAFVGRVDDVGKGLTKLERNVLSHGYDKHAVRQAEWGTPPISQTDYVNKVRDVQKNSDITSKLQREVGGKTVGKSYIGNTKTNEVLIKTGIGDPTFFKVQGQKVVDYIRGATSRDMTLNGWSKR